MTEQQHWTGSDSFNVLYLCSPVDFADVKEKERKKKERNLWNFWDKIVAAAVAKLLLSV